MCQPNRYQRSTFFQEMESLREVNFFVGLIILVSAITGTEPSSSGILADENDFGTIEGTLHSKSPLHLMHLARLDRLIYSELKKYERESQNRQNLVKRYIENFEKNSLRPDRIDDPEHWHWALEISSHPITALRLVRRMASLLPELLQELENPLETDLLDALYLEKDKHRLGWPSRHDITVITHALMDIPIVYDIPIKQLADGSFHGDPTMTLNAAERSEIAVSASERLRFATAVQWMDASMSRFRFEEEHRIYTIPEDLLDNNYQTSLLDHDFELQRFIASNVTTEKPLSFFWDEDFFTENIGNGLEDYEGRSLRHLHEIENIPSEFHPKMRFRHICRGANFQSEEELHTGHCIYRRGLLEALTLQPLKIEILNRFPLVLQVHDLVDPSTSLALILQAMGQLEELNGIQRQIEDNTEVLPVPASLNPTNTEMLSKFNTNMKFWKEISSGTSTLRETFGRLHVSVYSMTNYDSKLDVFQEAIPHPEKQVTLNIHLFLNTVENGGRTAFPTLGFSVKPERNSALIWSEFKTSSMTPQDAIWSNCPIISGNKWVASNYIRRNGADSGRDILRKLTSTFDN